MSSSCGPSSRQAEMKKYPNSRKGWHDYYVKVFNQTERPTAAVMALYFYLNLLAFGERPYSQIAKEG